MSKRNKIIIAIVAVGLLSLALLFFYNKSEKVYVLKEYDTKTKITDISEYVIRNDDTVFNGKFTRYNKKGIKIAEGNFLNGHIKGKCIYYYDDGKLESILYRKTSKITQESTEYYPTRKVKRYTMFDPFGLEAFIARYDEQSNIKSYEGYPLMEIYQYPIAHNEQFKIKTNQYLKVGDTLKHNYLVANIPNAKRSLNIELLGVDNSKIKRVVKQNPPVGIEVKEILTKKGINTIRSIVEYKFNNKEKTVIKDTLTFNVEAH